MPDQGPDLLRGHMLPMDVEGGPVEFAEVEIEAEATGGRPCVLVEQDGTLALLVDGTAGPALVGCSPAWLRELARTIARPRTRWSEGPGTLEPADDWVVSPWPSSSWPGSRPCCGAARRGWSSDSCVRFGPYVFDRRRFVLVAAGGEEVPLSAMRVDLVAAFALHQGRESG